MAWSKYTLCIWTLVVHIPQYTLPTKSSFTLQYYATYLTEFNKKILAH